MEKYHKINTVFKRDMNSEKKNIILGDWSLPEFKYLQNNIWVLTEKVDGTNVRIMLKSGVVSIAGKEEKSDLPKTLRQFLIKEFVEKPERLTKVFHGDICMYCEGYGAGIQKIGPKYRKDQDVILIDIRIGPWWLKREDVAKIAKSLNMDVVPVIKECSLIEAINLVKDGFNSTWGDFSAEGVVATPKVPLFSRDGSRIITKIKTRDFNS